jgi:AraC family transcriptional regulator
MSMPVSLSAAEFFTGHEHGASGRTSWHGGLHLRDGCGAFAWTDELGDAVEFAVTGDADFLHVSYWLRGGADFRSDGGNPRPDAVHAGDGILAYAPKRLCRFRRHGPYTNVVVRISTRDLLDFPDALDSGLRRNLERGFCLRDGFHGRILNEAALALFDGLRGGAGRPVHPPWLQAKSLEFVSLFLAVRTAPVTIIPAGERRCLLAARDRLLADLADPPTIPQLARECGLNVLKLKRGFKQLFGLGVHGLFQRERMHEAHRRLRKDESSVGNIAAELGYVNASHFAAAFRKEFGVTPAALKRGSPKEVRF